MAESTFSENIHTLRAKIGWQRGFTRDYANLGTREKEEIEEYLVSGLRNVYWPKSGYVWSFMRPLGTLVTVAAQWQYEQPGDFGGIEGDLTFSTTSTNYQCIPITSENAIRDMRQAQPGLSAIPRYAAVRPIAHEASHGQRFELIFWPTPNAAYTLNFTQIVNPNALTDANPFPYGGPMLAETILESCLAVAENRGDGEPGPHEAKFTELLSSSMALDGQLARAENLGPNLDRSGRPMVGRDRRLTTVTYNSVQY